MYQNCSVDPLFSLSHMCWSQTGKPPKKLSGIQVQIEKKLPYLGALKTDSHRKHETVLRP